MVTKGQLISKAIYNLLTSPKNRTDEFVLFAFLLFTANKSNSSVRFLGESMARQSAFWVFLTFSWTNLPPLQTYYYIVPMYETHVLLSRRNCTLKTSLVHKKSVIKQLSLLRIDDGNNVTEIEACLFVKPYLTKSFRIYFDLTRIYEMYACVGNHLCMVYNSDAIWISVPPAL